MDSGPINGVLLLDLKKAFDTIDHQILIEKLELYGVKNSVLKLFSSYLDKRTQVCRVNTVSSSPKHMSCGLPNVLILALYYFLCI